MVAESRGLLYEVLGKPVIQCPTMALSLAFGSCSSTMHGLFLICHGVRQARSVSRLECKWSEDAWDGIVGKDGMGMGME